MRWSPPRGTNFMKDGSFDGIYEQCVHFWTDRKCMQYWTDEQFCASNESRQYI